MNETPSGINLSLLQMCKPEQSPQASFRGNAEKLASAVVSLKTGDQDSSIEPLSGGANFSPLLQSGHLRHRHMMQEE